MLLLTVSLKVLSSSGRVESSCKYMKGFIIRILDLEQIKNNGLKNTATEELPKYMYCYKFVDIIYFVCIFLERLRQF